MNFVNIYKYRYLYSIRINKKIISYKDNYLATFKVEI